MTFIEAVRELNLKDPLTREPVRPIELIRILKDDVVLLVKKYAKKAKIRKNVHPHTFRHSCATAMLKNKADLNTIRKILGHTSLNTTQIYTHLNITDLKAVHKQCHPREKDRE